MHVHCSYQHVSRNPQLDKTIRSHVQKLDKHLVRFSPDLVRLHAALEFNAARQAPICSLNLWLPTARLHAKKEGGSFLAAVQTCFDELLKQVKKHKQVLRREGVWKRRRYKFQQETRELQAGELRVKDRQQLRDYLDQVLPQLQRFIARELRYREVAGVLPPRQAQEEEIVDEVVARALENVKTDSCDSVPFHRLVSEAIQVLNGPLCRPAAVAAGSSAATPDTEEPAVVSSSQKATAARLWRQRNTGAEDAAAGDGPEPDPVDLCLAFLPIEKRQIYVLHALEGFTWEETAQVLGQSQSEAEETFRQVSRKVSATLRES